MQEENAMIPNLAESRIIRFSWLLCGGFGFLLHVLFFERMASSLSSEMFDWALRKTGILAWMVFLGFPAFFVVIWTIKFTWPITASRQKGRFVTAFLCFQVLPALLGWWIGRVSLWGK